MYENISYIKQKRGEMEAKQKRIETEWQTGMRGLEAKRDNFLKRGAAITQKEAEKFQNQLMGEQQNIETVKQVITEFNQIVNWEDFHDIDHYVDFSCHRPGQDVRYAIDDSKLRNLGWSPIANFDQELKSIVKYYTKNFIW